VNETVAGRFRLDGMLGEGAMGVVYRGHDEVLDRAVALKEMRVPSGVNVEEALERFVTEARAAARLSDPSIVTVHDVVQDGDRVLIAMELLDGATLADAVAGAPGGLHPGAARDVLTKIASALATAHAQGVVHRDLKPDNVFWLPNGRVVVTDFGLARIGHGGGTQFGTVMGTPGYMAPEQLRGEHATPAADVFAWGVIAHELLSGSPPFGGAADEMTALMWKVVHEPAPPLHVPDDPMLSSIVEWALRKDPGSRPAQGVELLAALQGSIAPAPAAAPATGYSDGGQATSLPPSAPPGRQAAASGSRSPWLVAGIGAALTAVVATTVVLGLVLTSGSRESVVLTEVATRPQADEPRTAPARGGTADADTSSEAEEPEPEPEPEPIPAAEPSVPDGLTQLNARHFTILYPDGWTPKRIEELVAGGSYGLLDTTVTGDERDLAIVRVNTTEGRPTTDPSVGIQPIIDELRARPTYQELGFSRELLETASGSYDAIRWEYLLEHPTHPVLLHNVNYYIDAGAFSMALLTRAPATEFSRWDDVFDEIRRELVIQ
jgi:hypothetical protein